jgi:TolB protein
MLIGVSVFWCLVFLLFLAPFHNAGAQEKLQNLIVFSAITPEGWRLFSVRPDGKDMKPLTSAAEEEHFPAVSPDGKEILHLRSRMVWIMNSDGSGRKQVPLPKGIYAHPAWAPGGQEIAFVKYTVTPSDQSEIWIMKRQGERWREPDRVSLYPPMRVYPSYSPDGMKMAYTEFKRDQRLGAIEEIGIFDLSQKTFKNMTNDRVDNFKPAWSPTGEEIAYTSNRSGNYDIWVISLKDGKQRQLTREPAYDAEPAWSPEGREIAFISTRSGKREIWVMSALGDHPRQLTQTGKDCKDPFWVK